MEIRKGQRSPLTQILQNTNSNFQVELSISGVEVDFSCFGLNANDKLFNDEYMVFFNQPQTPCDAVLFTTEICSAIFSCDLNKLPEAIEKLSFTAAIDGQETMQQIQSGHLKFLVGSQEVACFHFDSSDFNSEKSLMLGDIYRKNGEWRFNAVGQGFNGGLEKLVSYFGSTTSEENNASSPTEKKQNETYIDTQSVINDLSLNQYALFAEEIQRLCGIEKELFNHVLELPHVFNNEKAGDDSSKSKNYFEDGIKNIENELQKLEKMEVVIAIVGTMKAGKSTTINAIVGTEVLPNRNAPMTTLPTLIRNVHGQIEPVLKLNKLKPLENLSKQIATKLAVLITSNEIGQIDLYNSQDGKELIDDLLRNQGYQFKTEYHGQEAIFSFLKHLNDLMRLAKEDFIQVEPPYAEYENLNDLPVIEIEFFHLKGKENKAQGSLAILDTPGPNEFGQSEALRKVFKTQLEKASAVGLVIDYTQMKSDSEATVRREVREVTKQLSKNNLYLLVNKFDQSNSNSMKKDEVKEYVVKTLMQSEIEPSQVYPISSQHAYLANRAKHNLEVHGKLPDFEKELWVADFGEQAMGKRWQSRIDDKNEVQESANSLWNDSYFNEPLDGIIREAHSSAAEKSVKSAMVKLVEWHKELTNTCSIINTSIGTDISKITQAINSLENNIGEFEEVKKNINIATENGLNELSNTLNQLADNNQQVIKADVESFFKEGKAMEQAAMDKKRNALIKQAKQTSFRDMAGLFLSGGEFDASKKRVENLNKRMVFDASNPVMNFSDKDDAEHLSINIQKSVVKIFDDLSEQFNEQSSLIVSKMADDISLNINQTAAESLKKAQGELGDSGFQLDLSLPKLRLELGSFNAGDLLAGGMSSKSETKTSSRRTKSTWGKVCSWFGTNDWGWEEYSYTQTSYQVDTTKIRNSVLSQLEAYKKDHTTQFESYLKREFEPTIAEHINGLTSYLARYRDLLESGKKTNQLAQESKKQLAQQIGLLANKNKMQSNDIKVVEQHLG
jgi:stress response protein SCP2/GTPase SAR1 family protein